MPEGENPELGIRITTDAAQAQAGIKGVTASVDELGRASDRAAGPINALGNIHGSAFGKIVTGSRAASGAMRGFFEMSRGGIFTIGGLARAFNDLLIVIRSAAGTAGPFALLALGIGVVIGVLRGLATHSGAASSKLRETNSSAQDLKTGLHSMAVTAKEDLGALKETVDALAKSFEDVSRAIKDTEERTKALEAAAKELELAKLSSAEATAVAGAKTPEEADAIRAKFASSRAEVEGRYKDRAEENAAMGAANVIIPNARQFLEDTRAARTGRELSLGRAEAAADTAVGRSSSSLRQFERESTPGSGASKGDIQAAYENYRAALVAATVALQHEKDLREHLNKFNEEMAPKEEQAREAIQRANTTLLASPILREANALNEGARQTAAGTRGAAAEARGEARTNAEVLKLEQEMLHALEEVLPKRTIRDYAGTSHATSRTETIYTPQARALIRDIDARKAKIAQGKGGDTAGTQELIDAVTSLMKTMDGKVDALNDKALSQIRTLESQIKNSTRGN